MLDENGQRTNEVFEELFKVGQAPEYLVSSTGRKAIRKNVQLVARTKTTWSDSCGTHYGVNGYYNRGLGCRVHSDKEAESIAKSQGMIRLDEVSQDKYFIDDHVERVNSEYMREEKEYNDMMSKYESWGVIGY
ncbi:MAG TPA: hypothetical protein PLW93_05750 [Candidatus Absconditabacterales bacterium]|nr:hypothetical protein [Candidatus Absconditabacterales bacterium]